MLMKRFAAAAAAGILLCGFCTGCGQTKKKQIDLVLKLPPISMNAVNDTETTDTYVFLEKAAEDFSEIYTAADVSIKVEEFEYTKEDAAIPGCFDTDNAADILYEGYFNMSTYIHTGRVVPLDDIISDELRADVEQSIWDMSTVEGKTYMMPFLSLQNVMIYNKELFRKCGLEQYISEDSEQIGSWTLEQWEQILDALAAGLPEQCYPMMMYAKNDQGDTHIMTFLRSHGCTVFDENNNFCINSPEGIEALQWLKDGYDRGWYPPQCENLEIADNTELFANGQLALMLINNASFSHYDRSDYGFVNFPCEDGTGIATAFVTGFEVFDNGDEDKTAASKAFVRYICETDKWADYSTGGIPARDSVAEKYFYQVDMLDSCIQNNRNVVDFTHNLPNWRGVRDVFYPCIHKLLTGRMTAEETAAAIDADCNSAIDEGRRSSELHQ